MTKYQIPDDHNWQEDQEQDETETERPTFEVGYHTVQIDDNRESHGYEYGLDWLFAFEEGALVGYTLGHYLEGRTQSDYMNTPEWTDVPGYIKGLLRQELNLEPGQEIPTDLPDFYGESDE